MAQQIVNIGTANNSGDGESLRSGGDKINDNFTELYSAYSSNVIVVNQVSDFGIIDSTKKYLINGFVDTGSTTINIPDGVKLNLVGLGYILSGLFSTENNYTMFQGNVAGVSDFSVSQLDLKVTGTSSKLFDIKGKTGFEVVRFNSVNFSDCTSIGVIDGFRQGEEFDTGRFGGTPQIEFKGTNYTVVGLATAVEMKPDIALFSAGGNTSLEWAPKFAEVGTTVVDNSSAWRMDPTKKLVVPEINASELTKDDKIIANPNCSTIQLVMALNPLHKKYKMKSSFLSF